jgi:hypothetical protein
MIGELNTAMPGTPVMVTHLYQLVLLDRAVARAAGIQPAVEAVDVAREREHNRRG